MPTRRTTSARPSRPGRPVRLAASHNDNDPYAPLRATVSRLRRLCEEERELEAQLVAVRREINRIFE